MLIQSVIIFFQEVFEAALLTGLLLALSRQLKTGKTWLWQAVVAGLAGAVLYAINLARLSEWLDYRGQELTNAVLLSGIYACLLVLLVLSVKLINERRQCWINRLMAMAVALSMMLEGSEILVYATSFRHQPDNLLTLVTGSLIGSAIGASCAALIYYALVRYPGKLTAGLTRLLLAITSAAVLTQGSQQLVQVDWLPAGPMLWDSSGLVSEDSLAGHLLYALLGYEASPAVSDIASYAAALLLVAAGCLLAISRRKKDDN